MTRKDSFKFCEETQRPDLCGDCNATSYVIEYVIVVVVYYTAHWTVYSNIYTALAESTYI